MNDNSKYSFIITILSILLVISAVFNIILYLEKSPAPENKQAINLTPEPTIYSTPTPTPAREMTLNKSYTFAITDGAGNKLGSFTFLISKISRTKEVDTGLQKVTAVAGKELLIVDAELTNNDNISAKANTRNYLRLKAEGSDKLSAPDFHPDPLDLTPKSTKSVRFGFAIAETDTDLVLQVGELDGPKDSIIINFEGSFI